MVLFGALAFIAFSFLPDDTVSARAMGGAALVALLGLVACFAKPREPQDDPERIVEPPVTGRWIALNSPSTKVPSHGIRAYGQAYAIDLARWPDEGGLAWGDGWARPEAVAGFGDPVRAMVDGEVVRASGWRRDHRCRTSTPALVYMFAEGMIREIGGPNWILGNHVVIRAGDGTYAAVAHLRRGSLRVRPGDQVRAGQVIAECGNSGNTSVPHVHAQLMDRPSVATGLGLPLRFRGVSIEEPDAELPKEFTPEPVGERYSGVPADGELLVVAHS